MNRDRIATKLRRRARAKVKSAERKRATEARAERWRRRWVSARLRPRVVVSERDGVRTLIIRGSHISTDAWFLLVMTFSFLGVPLAVLLALAPGAWLAGALALMLTPVLVAAWSPMRISVSDDGLFEARRPLMPTRDFGRAHDLNVEVYRDGHNDYAQVCILESRGERLWRVTGLAPCHTAVIDHFVASIVAPRPRATAELGSYRTSAREG